MSIIEITKAHNLRRSIRYRINTDDLTADQRELIEGESLIYLSDGREHDEVESVLNNTESDDMDVPDYQDSENPEVTYDIAEL
ncbi:MAG: hypothetical protein ACTMIV_10910 [Brevibacterium aurantiacum]